MISKKTLKNTTDYLLDEINNKYIPLIQTQKDHIETLKKFIFGMRKELIWLLNDPNYPDMNLEDVQEVITTMIYYIDKLEEYER